MVVLVKFCILQSVGSDFVHVQYGCIFDHFKSQKFPLTPAENIQRQNGRCQINLCSSIRLLPGWWFPHRVWLLHREDIASIAAILRTDIKAGYGYFLCLLGSSWDKSKSYRWLVNKPNICIWKEQLHAVHIFDCSPQQLTQHGGGSIMKFHYPERISWIWCATTHQFSWVWFGLWFIYFRHWAYSTSV